MPMLAPSAPPISEFDHAADLVLALAELTAAARARLGITATVQARQIGIAPTTLTRLEAGGEPMRSTIVAALRWLAATEA